MASAFRRARLKHVVIHTGQHYDDEMSDRFFRELGLPRPDLNLGVQGGGHAQPTATMLGRLSRVFEEIGPTVVVVYGDTTSTLAGALAGAQCGVPVAHVEAGLRSYLQNQPEERNRVVADHLSTWLFAPTPVAVANLKKEGITSGVHRVGDPMHDAQAHYLPLARSRPLLTREKKFVLVTVHRAENTDDPRRLKQLTKLLGSITYPVLLPLHPRTRDALHREGLYSSWSKLKHVRLLEPLGYLDTLHHVSRALAVLTDSGGVQREAAWLGTPCLTLRPVTEWTDTIRSGANHLVDLSPARVKKALATARRGRASKSRHQGASDRIASILKAA